MGSTKKKGLCFSYFTFLAYILTGGTRYGTRNFLLWFFNQEDVRCAYYMYTLRKTREQGLSNHVVNSGKVGAQNLQFDSAREFWHKKKLDKSRYLCTDHTKSDCKFRKFRISAKRIICIYRCASVSFPVKKSNKISLVHVHAACAWGDVIPYAACAPCASYHMVWHYIICWGWRSTQTCFGEYFDVFLLFSDGKCAWNVFAQNSWFHNLFHTYQEMGLLNVHVFS